MPEGMPKQLAEMPLWMQGWPGGCRDVWEDAQEYSGFAVWMQGCPGRCRDTGQPVPVEELKHSPVSKSHVGSVLGITL